jgi:hypothetical protein
VCGLRARPNCLYSRGQRSRPARGAVLRARQWAKKTLSHRLLRRTPQQLKTWWISWRSSLSDTSTDFALLRKSMVPWLVHLVRTALLRAGGDRVDAILKLGPRCGLHLGGGGDRHWPRLQGQPHCQGSAEPNLPLRFGGLGLRLPGSGGGEVRVARLSSITLTQQVLHLRAACLHPFNGPQRTAWQEVWPRCPTCGTRA